MEKESLFLQFNMEKDREFFEKHFFSKQLNMTNNLIYKLSIFMENPRASEASEGIRPTTLNKYTKRK